MSSFNVEETKQLLETSTDVPDSIYAQLLTSAVAEIEYLRNQERYRLTCAYRDQAHDIFWWTDPNANADSVRVMGHDRVHMFLKSIENHTSAVLVGNLVDPPTERCYEWSNLPVHDNAAATRKLQELRELAVEMASKAPANDWGDGDLIDHIASDVGRHLLAIIDADTGQPPPLARTLDTSPAPHPPRGVRHR